MKTLPPSDITENFSEQVKVASRAKYCRPINEIQTREAQEETQEKPAPEPPSEVENQPSKVDTKTVNDELEQPEGKHKAERSKGDELDFFE